MIRVIALLLALFAVDVGAAAKYINNGKQQFLSATGTPLAGGKVYTYQHGTGTLVNTYQDAALTVLNTNPITLDSAGEATIWAPAGIYTQKVYDASLNLIWTADVGEQDPTLGTFADGTVGSPSIAFTNQLTTGFYRPGSNTIGIAIAGSQAFTFSSGELRGPAGTAGAPAFSFILEPALGLYRPSAGTMAMAAGGSTIARFSAAQTLVPKGTASVPGLGFIGDNLTGMYDAGGNVIGFSTGGVMSATLSNGNFSLAGNSSSNLLSLASKTTTGFASINWNNDAGKTNWQIKQDSSSVGFDLNLHRYNPANTYVDTPLMADWATGEVFVNGVGMTTSGQASNAYGNSKKLPGGLLIQWGTFAVNPPVSDITYPTAFTAVPSLTATVMHASSTSLYVTISGNSTTGATFACPGLTTCTIYWQAIGY